MNRNHSIDILRCVFAFMVVYLHTHYWIGYPMDVCRCAVPGFMVMTGYFVYLSDKSAMYNRLLKSAKHHMEIYGWALLLYFFLMLWLCNKYNNFSAFSVSNLHKFLIYAEVDFLPYGFHLWYLHAVIYALLIIYLFSKYNVLKYLVWLTPFFLILNLELFKELVRPYIGSYHLPTYISFGIPFLIIGMSIQKYEERLKKIPAITWPLMSAFFFFLLFIERKTLMNVGINPNDKYVCTIFLIIILLMICIAYPARREGPVATIGRKYSLDIYVFHNFILFLYYSLRDHLPSIINNYVFKYGSPILIFVFTLIFSMAFRYILSRFYIIKSIKDAKP